MQAAAGEVSVDIKGRRMPLEGTAAGEVLRNQRPERLVDASARLRFSVADDLNATTALVVPLVFRGEAVGVLIAFDRMTGGPQFTADDQRLMQAFAATAASAVTTAQNVAAEGLRRGVEASERERLRRARELHDESLQEIAALRVTLSSARRTGDHAILEDAVDQSLERASSAIEALRALITDMRPAALDELGIGAAIDALVERTQRLTHLDVASDVSLAHEDGRRAQRLTAETEVAIYRVVQEALNNAVKHAPGANVEICIDDSDDTVKLTVSDDGPGFVVGRSHNGFGLIGIGERVTLAGGTMNVESHSGTGTTVRATLPVRLRSDHRRPRVATG